MAQTAKPERTYGQWCPIAVGLDLVGDRWTLLICRELVLAEARFTDLRKALPGLAPNLLTERLRALVDAGLVDHVELAGPAPRAVYRLTADGRAKVVPVLRALARVGADRLQGAPPAELEARRAAAGFLAPWYRPAADPITLRLVVGEDHVDCELGARVFVVGATIDEPDVVLATTSAALAAARRGEPLEATMRGRAAARTAALERLQLTLAR